MAREFTPANLAALRVEYDSANQGHVFQFWDELNDSEKATYFRQLAEITPGEVNGLRELAVNPPSASDQPPVVEPLPESRSISALDANKETIGAWNDAGLDAVLENKVAVVLLAGGQGTRLGFDAPKGCYDINLPSHKTLFQIQAERILKVQELAKARAKATNSNTSAEPQIPWYIMTSGPTRAHTEDFFEGTKPLEPLSKEANDRRLAGKPYFGLKKEQVHIFEQGILPCLDNSGKFMLKTKGELAVAPDGNGGIYKALRKPTIKDEKTGDYISIVQHMEAQGVEHVHAYCVDNSLAKVADPVFLGWASQQQNVKIATKVVRKEKWDEPVGLIMQKNGRPDVVEYSEIDDATAQAEDPSHKGLLRFRAANIVNHYYSVACLKTEYTLPPHVAKKAIPYYDGQAGKTVKPDGKNGIKLEQFIFDNFKELDLNEFASFEVDRLEEFSPLKNHDPKGSEAPEDCPITSRRDIMSQGGRWLKAAGATVEAAEPGVEVPPLVSYAGEGLEGYSGQTVHQQAI